MTKNEIETLFVDDVSHRAKLIRDFVMDKTQPYGDRLHIWKTTPPHLQEKEQWIWHHPTMKDDEWMHYDWWSRNEEIDLTDFAEYREWDEETIRKFYEGCLDEGVWGFTFDW